MNQKVLNTEALITARDTNILCVCYLQLELLSSEKADKKNNIKKNQKLHFMVAHAKYSYLIFNAYTIKQFLYNFVI